MSLFVFKTATLVMKNTIEFDLTSCFLLVCVRQIAQSSEYVYSHNHVYRAFSLT